MERPANGDDGSGSIEAGPIATHSRVATTPVPRVGIVEPLRGLAAFAVAWFHFTNGGGLLSEGWLKASGKYGWLGVQVFFVISGFIIPYALYHSAYLFPQHMGRFVLKRVIRLDPPYIAAIIGTIALGFLSAAAPGFRGSAPQIEWIPLVLHLGYLNAFFGYPWVIPVLWTLAIEFQFYLLISVSLPVLVHRSWILRTVLFSTFLGLPFLVPGEAFVFRYLGLFALGLVTFQKYVGFLSVRAFLLHLAAAVTVATFSLGATEAFAGLLAALLIAFLKVPSWAPLNWLGAVSYSLYLLHVPVGGRVVNLGSRWADDALSQVAVLVLAVAISLIASYLMYRWIELPARQWSSSLRYERKSARPLDPVTPELDLSNLKS